MASFVPADVQNEKSSFTNGNLFFSAYAIDGCLRRGKNSSPAFVIQVPFVQIMDSLLYLSGHCCLVSKLIIERTQMCTSACVYTKWTFEEII